MIDNLVFVDTETTGLDPIRHEIIEIGIIVIKPDTFEDLEVYGTKIAPAHVETADEKALLINNYSYDAWLNAPTMVDVLPTIEKFFTIDNVVGGHNVGFDIAFLQAAFDSHENVSSLNYAGIIDTQELSKNLKVATASYRLGALCQKLGISHENAHTATADIRANVELFKLLQRQYRFSLPEIIKKGIARKQRVTRKGILSI